MSWLTEYASASVGKKQIVGVTGIMLLGFLIVHLAGNLLIFAGPAAFNEYAHKLITNPLIIPAEIVLALVFVVHITMAIRVSVENRRARGPVRYFMVQSRRGPSRRTFASQTMIVTGVWTLVFLVLHLITFKFGAHYQVKGDAAAHGPMRDLYRLVIEVFQRPGYVAWYVASMIALGLHLQHGSSSVFQTFGIDHPKWTPPILVFGKIFGWAIALGYLSIPAWVYFAGVKAS